MDSVPVFLRIGDEEDEIGAFFPEPGATPRRRHVAQLLRGVADLLDSTPDEAAVPRAGLAVAAEE